ncbi:helix-turn-helix transcriptional regulator [Enterococcus cecorum]|nr:helix-turn-helix transcriptional regulator [Enterococcus cecorum]
MYRLSKMTGIPEVTINNIKHKRIKSISFYATYKIAKALEIDLEELVPDEWKETE